MSEIDWSKAPEGATHYQTAEDKFKNGVFWRVCNSSLVEAWPVGYDGLVFGSSIKYEKPGFLRIKIDSLIPRPSPAWNGEGLPPVGTVCEYNASSDRDKGKELWCEVVIKYLSEWVIVFECTKAPKGHEESVGVELFGDISERIEKRFRPIRTPEQIAADEREAAIEELRKLLSNVARYDYHAAVAMIDAGYRKQADK